MQQHAVSVTSDSTAFRERHLVSTVAFVSLALLWVLSIVVSINANPSNAIPAAVFFGIFIVITLAAWYNVAKRHSRLEISGDAIVYQKGRQGVPVTLSRTPADDATLWHVPKTHYYNMFGPDLLALVGTGGIVPLTGMPVDKVTRACRSRGWSFGTDKQAGKLKAATDVQCLLHAGQPVAAGQFIEVFGSFGTPWEDEPRTSVDAAIFEDIGDRVIRLHVNQGRNAYHRAASEQRAFADRAASPQERAERLAVADRIEAKTRYGMSKKSLKSLVTAPREVTRPWL